MGVLPALNRSVARLNAPGGGYCSGALIAPDIVLTCAHFFRERPHAGARVRVDGSVFPVDSLNILAGTCLLYTSPSPRDKRQSRMPSSA